MRKGKKGKKWGREKVWRTQKPPTHPSFPTPLPSPSPNHWQPFSLPSLLPFQAFLSLPHTQRPNRRVNKRHGRAEVAIKGSGIAKLRASVAGWQARPVTRRGKSVGAGGYEEENRWDDEKKGRERGIGERICSRGKKGIRNGRNQWIAN